MQTLDPLSLPLHGQILIEASAGTGKTYTIGLLFLRLLLERRQSIEEILVVTFTRAATEELRGRIRLRIREALNELDAPGQGDELLGALIAAVDDKAQARILLTDALTRMDEAAISTIHGFCQRILQQHAFASGASFEMEFLETEALLRQRIIEDFWRLRFYHCDGDEAAWATRLWSGPQALLDNLGGHLSQAGIRCIPQTSDEQVQKQAIALIPALEKVQYAWLKYADEITELLQTNKRLSRDNSKAYGKQRLETAINSMQQLIDSGNIMLPTGEEIALFTRSKIEASLKKTGKAEPPEHSFFDLFEGFYAQQQEMMRNKKFALLLAARDYVFEQLKRRKAMQSQLYFDDLLIELDAALRDDHDGQFAASISQRFPLILVDEFQDTDPLQYQIFARIHAAGKQHNPANTGLFLIGDPKQAIYAFRGADIFTYLQARNDTLPAQRFTMSSNYRSTPAMVASVNQLFDQPDSFLFKDIPFSPVKAAGNANATPLTIKALELPAMNCLLLPEGAKHKPLPKGDAETAAARFCAHEIATLILSGQSGEALIGEQALTAGDIAVLVRTHKEAGLIRDALNLHNISSVYISQESVFESHEAGELLKVLSSLNDLKDEARVRTALTTSLFGYHAEQIDALLCNEEIWEQTLRMLAGYRKIYLEKGFAQLFQSILKEQQLVSRLHGLNNGERILTNFLHLAELLQAAAPDSGGLESLLRWLSDQIHAPEQASEAQQLRLESDENLVKIVTIHASKGLEYPLIFLPFLWSARPCSENKPLSFHADEYPEQLTIDLGSGDETHYKLAEKERLAGDLRLLYVALTRARYACYFCWGRMNKMQESALCKLLHPQGVADTTDLVIKELGALDTRVSALRIMPFPDGFPPLQIRAAHQDQPLQLKTFSGHIDSRWRITSYSGLVSAPDSHREQPDYDRVQSSQPQSTEQNCFGFPRGADAGICLHTIFELIAFDEASGHPAIIRDQLARAGYAESWQEVVQSWVQDILDTELSGGGALAHLERADRINEMAFFFPLESVGRDQFNQILRQHVHAPLPPGGLHYLHGLMGGFIDLVFEHQGKYFVADYKSNHLGNTYQDYRGEQLQSAMDQHRYDLQYLIYSLALHRYLAERIKDYRYEHHFGGVYYLFLRGMHPQNPAGTGVYHARPEAALIESLDRLFAGSSS